jgi:hypothetical protein
METISLSVIAVIAMVGAAFLIGYLVGLHDRKAEAPPD